MDLKTYLKENRWSVKAFSEQMGINQQYAGKVINKKHKPGLELAARIEDWTAGEVPMRSFLKDKKDLTSIEAKE